VASSKYGASTPPPPECPEGQSFPLACGNDVCASLLCPMAVVDGGMLRSGHS
jgi:hypothetical protein